MRRLVVAIVLLLGVAVGIWFATRTQDGPAPTTIDDRSQAAADVEHDPAVAAGVGEGDVDTVDDKRSVVAESKRDPNDASPTVADSAAGAGVLIVHATYGDGEGVVRGMPVYVRWASSGFTHWSKRLEEDTDDRGTARFEGVVPGTVNITGADGGHRNAVIPETGEVTVNLVVPRGFSVDGTVVDSAGAPIEGAEIWLSDSWSSNRGSVRARTDERGQFGFDHLTGTRFVGVSARGFASSNLRQVTSTTYEVIPLRFELVTGGTGGLRGEVLDHASQPIVGAEILVGPIDPNRRVRGADGSWVLGPPSRSAVSDAEGRFEVDRVAPGERLIRVRADGFGLYRAEVTIVADVVGEHVARLGPGATITGVVTDAAGEPAARAVVHTVPSGFDAVETRSDANGNYTLENVEIDKEHEVEARVRRSTGRSKVHVLAVAEYRVDLQLEDPDKPRLSGNVVRGKVVDALGEPLNRWRVVLTAAGSIAGKRQIARTNSDGEFEQEVPWRAAAVSAYPPLKYDSFPRAFEPSVAANGVQVTLRASDPLATTGSIRGRVIDAAGTPRAASIRVWHTVWKLYAKFDNNPETGGFRIDHVHAGVNKIDIHGDDFPWIRGGDREVFVGQVLDLGDLIVSPAGWLAGAVSVRGGIVPDELRIVVVRDGSEAGVVKYAGGRLKSSPLAAADDYMVVASGTGVVSIAKHGVQVRAGNTTTLDLAFERAAIRELRFALPHGTERPAWFSVTVSDQTTRRSVWSGGPMPHEDLAVLASLPLGDFTVVARGPAGELGEWALRVTTLTDAQPVTFSL